MHSPRHQTNENDPPYGRIVYDLVIIYILIFYYKEALNFTLYKTFKTA